MSLISFSLKGEGLPKVSTGGLLFVGGFVIKWDTCKIKIDHNQFLVILFNEIQEDNLLIYLADLILKLLCLISYQLDITGKMHE